MLVGTVDAMGWLAKAGCEVVTSRLNLRMRQEDDTDKVEQACYESHCVYVFL